MPRMPNTEREALAEAVKHGSLVLQRGVYTYPNAPNLVNDRGERTPTFKFQTGTDVVQALLEKGYLARAGANTVRPTDKGRQRHEAGDDSTKTAASESKSFQEEHDEKLAAERGDIDEQGGNTDPDEEKSKKK